MSGLSGGWKRRALHVGLTGGLLALAVSGASATASARSTAHVSASSAPALVSIGEGLKGPKGVTASVYTKGLPDVSDLAYDSQGRLWASATGDPGAAPPAPGNGVYILAAGKAPVKVLGGSEVKYPIGIVWAGKTLIVSNYGYIEAWSGFNGKTFASHKVLFSGLAAGSSGWTDNGAVGPDGKVYLNVGAACDACQPTGKLEADVISFKPNGTDLSVYATRVRGNSFVEFMPGTDDLFAAMNQQNGLVPAPHDQLGIIRKGDDWGFPTCYGQGGAVCNGVATEVAPLPVHNGSSSMALVNGQLGSAYGTSAFVTSVSTGVVERAELTKTASGYTSNGTYQFLSGLTSADGIILTPQHTLLVGNYATGTIYEISVNTKVNPGATATIKYVIPAVVTGKESATPTK
jgi:glucose/arabinose dehydrogenase